MAELNEGNDERYTYSFQEPDEVKPVILITFITFGTGNNHQLRGDKTDNEPVQNQ